MNKINGKLLLLSITILIVITGAMYGMEKGKTAIVALKDGIELKENNYETIIRIPYGSEVLFELDKHGRIVLGKLDKVFGVRGNWIKASYQGKTGWVFGGFLERTKEEYGEIIKIYKKEGVLSALEKIPWTFDFTLWESENDIDNIFNNINPVGFIIHDGGKLFGDTGVGGSYCQIEKILEKDNTLIFTIESIECIEYENNDDVSDCLKEKRTIYEYTISNEIIQRILRGRYERYDIVGKVLSTEIRTDLK